MTRAEYKRLVERGEQIFMEILEPLNNLSDAFIRTRAKGYNQYRELRRYEDWQEVCLALALYERKLMLDKRLDHKP